MLSGRVSARACSSSVVCMGVACGPLSLIRAWGVCFALLMQRIGGGYPHATSRAAVSRTWAWLMHSRCVSAFGLAPVVRIGVDPERGTFPCSAFATGGCRDELFLVDLCTGCERSWHVGSESARALCLLRDPCSCCWFPLIPCVLAFAAHRSPFQILTLTPAWLCHHAANPSNRCFVLHVVLCAFVRSRSDPQDHRRAGCAPARVRVLGPARCRVRDRRQGRTARGPASHASRLRFVPSCLLSSGMPFCVLPARFDSSPTVPVTRPVACPQRLACATRACPLRSLGSCLLCRTRSARAPGPHSVPH